MDYDLKAMSPDELRALRRDCNRSLDPFQPPSFIAPFTSSFAADLRTAIDFELTERNEPLRVGVKAPVLGSTPLSASLRRDIHPKPGSVARPMLAKGER